MGMSRATLPSYWQSTSLQDLLREQMSIPNDLVEDDAIEDCTWARYGRGWLLHSGAADVLAAHAIPARNPVWAAAVISDSGVDGFSYAASAGCW